MAQVKMSVEELLQLARGEMPVDEIKEQLAKGMLEIWNSETSKVLIEEEAERLSKVVLERTIRDAYVEKQGAWGRPNEYAGWAMPILREALLQNFSIPTVLEAIKPEIDQLVEDSLSRAISKLVLFNKEGQ